MTTDNNQEAGLLKSTNGDLVFIREGRKSQQFLCALIASIGALICGCSMFWSPPNDNFRTPTMGFEDITSINVYLAILVSLQNAGNFIQELTKWLTFWFLIGGIIGALLSGYTADRFGRKGTLMSCLIPWICSWVMLLKTENADVLYMARFVCGVITGIFSTVVPMYLTEIAEDSVRGTLGSMFHLFLSLGSLLAVTVTDYTALHYTCIALTGVCFILFFFIPESPVYLSKKNVNVAKEALKRLRGADYNVDSELLNLHNQDQITPRPTAEALLISIGLTVGQKFCGIDYIIFSAASKIFPNAPWTSVPVTRSSIIGGLLTLGTLLCCIVVDRVGRKNLLIGSGICMTIYLTVLAPLLSGTSDIENLKAIMVVAFVIAYSMGFGPLPWMMPGELFPPRTRGFAFGITAAANWLGGFLFFLFYTFALDTIVNHYSVAVLLMAFAVISATSAGFTYFFLPETKGKSIQQIQSVLLNRV